MEIRQPLIIIFVYLLDPSIFFKNHAILNSNEKFGLVYWSKIKYCEHLHFNSLSLISTHLLLML